MVPSDCMIMSMDGSGGAAGVSDGRAPLRMTTVLEDAGAPVDVAGCGCSPCTTDGPRLASCLLRSSVCLDIFIATALRSRSSWVNPLTRASISLTFFSIATIRSSVAAPVPEISSIGISFSFSLCSYYKIGDLCIMLVSQRIFTVLVRRTPYK